MIDAMGKALQEKMTGYQEEMLRHFKALLRINSVRGERRSGAPFGPGNREALDYVLGLSRRFGLETVNLDYFAGYSEYGRGQEYVCAVAHLDVVPPGDGWSHPPFGAQEQDGVIYARGAGDDKPGVIAGLYALRCMKELGYRPRRRIRVIYGCAEETGMEDMEHYFKTQPLPAFGFTPDSDGYDIVNAEKGRMELVLEGQIPAGNPMAGAAGGVAPNMVPDSAEAVFDTGRLTGEERERLEEALAAPGLKWTQDGECLTVAFEGVSAHAAMPEEGRNAISLYARFACRVLGERADPLTRFIDEYIGFDWSVPRLGIACRDEHMGSLTMNLGLLKTDGRRIWAVGDIRYPTVTDSRAIQEGLRQKADEEGLGFQVLSAVDGHCCTSERDFAILREVCLDKGKPEPRCTAIAGGTYAKKFQGRLVAFGGCGGAVHAPDEFVAIPDFFEHADIVCYALYRLGGGTDGGTASPALQHHGPERCG